MVANFVFIVENEHFIQGLVLLNKTLLYITNWFGYRSKIRMPTSMKINYVHKMRLIKVWRGFVHIALNCFSAFCSSMFFFHLYYCHGL